MLVQKIKNEAKLIIKNKFYPIINFYNYFNKNSERIISRNEIFNYQTNLKKITRQDKKFFINFDNFIEEKNTHIDKKLNSIFGWVPYLKDKSKILIYHFFSVNYALRKNFLIRLTLINHRNIVAQNCFWLNPAGIKEIDLNEIWKGLEGQAVFAEAFHPKLPLNHATMDGVMRYWGNYYDSNDNLQCTCHSLPLEKKAKFEIKDLWSRSLLSKHKDEKNYHYSIGCRLNRENENTLTRMGFNIIVNNNNEPKSVWHNGSACSKTFINPEPIEELQGFWCPPMNDIDPVIFIDEKETKLDKQNLTFAIINGTKIIEKKDITASGSYKAKISEIFGRKIEAPYFLVCKFHYKHEAKIVVTYDSTSSSGDCGHAWSCEWKINNDELVPLEIDNKSTARKFFHFQNNVSDKSIQYYLLLYINKKKNYSSKEIKIRFLLDNKKEFLTSIEINFKQPMISLNLNDLLDLDKVGEFNKGIIQIESLYDNVRGHFYICDNKNSVVATDHLTGG